MAQVTGSLVRHDYRVQFRSSRGVCRGAGSHLAGTATGGEVRRPHKASIAEAARERHLASIGTRMRDLRHKVLIAVAQWLPRSWYSWPFQARTPGQSP